MSEIEVIRKKGSQRRHKTAGPSLPFITDGDEVIGSKLRRFLGFIWKSEADPEVSDFTEWQEWRWILLWRYPFGNCHVICSQAVICDLYLRSGTGRKSLFWRQHRHAQMPTLFGCNTQIRRITTQSELRHHVQAQWNPVDSELVLDGIWARLNCAHHDHSRGHEWKVSEESGCTWVR